MHRFSSLILLLFFWIRLCAQEPVNAERPSETQGTNVLEKGKIQLETGYEMVWNEASDRTIRHPEILVRYGLLKKLELRLDLIRETQEQFSKNEFRKGWQPLQVGLKLPLWAAPGHAFRSALLGQVGIPGLASADHDPGTWIHRIRLALEQHCHDQLIVGANIGTEWDSEEQEQNWIYSFSPQFEFSEEVKVFVEAFGYFKKGRPPEHLVHGGLAFLPWKNLQLDLSFGKGISREAAESFFRSGFALRIP